MAKFKMDSENFNFIKTMFDGVNYFLCYKKLTKNDIVF